MDKHSRPVNYQLHADPLAAGGAYVDSTVGRHADLFGPVQQRLGRRLVLVDTALRHEQSRLCRHQLDGPGSQRPVCGMVAEALHHRGRDPLHESDFLDQWRRDWWTKYFGQRRVERLKFGTSFSFRDGADELMEAGHHFSRRARRQQDQPDRYWI